MADVRILLQRVDDPARPQLSHLNLRRPPRSLPLGGEAPQDASAGTAAHVTCLRRSQNSITCGSLLHSPAGTSEAPTAVATAAAVASYGEPIEEDFPSGVEKQAPDGARQAAQNPGSTSRGGRTRKRTTCRCCVPSSGGPAAKMSARWPEAEPAERMETRTGGKPNRKRPDSGLIQRVVLRGK